MQEIQEGDEVTWTEYGRLWRGEVVRVGVLHTLVRPTQPPGSAGWITKAKLTKVMPLALICTDYELMREYGDLGGTEAEALKK